MLRNPTMVQHDRQDREYHAKIGRLILLILTRRVLSNFRKVHYIKLPIIAETQTIWVPSGVTQPTAVFGGILAASCIAPRKITVPINLKNYARYNQIFGPTHHEIYT